MSGRVALAIAWFFAILIGALIVAAIIHPNRFTPTCPHAPTTPSTEGQGA